MIIKAPGQARLDSAQAQSLLLVAALPYLAAVVGTIVLGLMFLCTIGIFIIIVVVKDMLNKPRSDALRWNGHLRTLSVPVWATTQSIVARCGVQHLVDPYTFLL